MTSDTSSAPTPAETPTVLFIVTSFWAYGELTIAVEFAKRARSEGFRPLFLAPPSHRAILNAADMAHTVLIPGAGRINRIQMRDLEHVHRPRIVVLADFLNFAFCERHYGLCEADLEIFSGVVGTFDNFDWERPFGVLDTYGFRARHQDELSTEKLAFRLRPCPLNSPRAPDQDGKAINYPLLDHAGPSAHPSPRRDLGLGDGPVVLLTTATWQHTHAAYPRVHKFVETCNSMLEHLLRQVRADATIVSVGPRMLFRGSAPDNFVDRSQLAPQEFERYAQCADVFLSSNITSVTLHRLALQGVPSLVLYSSVAADPAAAPSAERRFPLSDFAERLIDETEYLYPFRMFPVGWFHFLDSLLADNPFCETVRQVELFDEDAVLQTLDALLFHPDEHMRLQQGLERYLAELHALPDVGQVLTHLAGLSERNEEATR